MESLERKDASTGPDEPIKSEGMVQSPDTSERSNSAASPPPNCSICLGKLINTSFTDSCLHQFCFTCLLQWSKIKTECPLCKQTFKSIIHNVRSEEDYDQYHVQYTSQVAATLDVTADIHISGQWDVAVGVPVRPFMYRYL
jgi:E3 ubiquitin-protein ligase Topors